MNSSARVDVVMAPETVEPAPLDAGLVPAAPTADIAPDPARRIVMVATTKDAGADEARARGFDPVAVVTPRSPHAAYGVVADEVVWSEALTPEARAELEPHVLPVLATTRTEER
jgi:hypothetical protein